MTGDLGAHDNINWVLTSYIVAAAIMTPVTAEAPTASVARNCS
jgi:hypothetical protein